MNLPINYGDFRIQITDLQQKASESIIRIFTKIMREFTYNEERTIESEKVRKDIENISADSDALLLSIQKKLADAYAKLAEKKAKEKSTWPASKNGETTTKSPSHADTPQTDEKSERK
jgi:hypothetical protein